MLKPQSTQPEQESNRLGLEFANTALWHASDYPEETLQSYADLVKWAQALRLVSGQGARRLLGDAADRPAEADRVLKRAVALREAIYRIFAAVVHAKSPSEADLAELNHTLTRMTGGARLVRATKGFAWDWNVDKDALDSPLFPIALSAAELLTSDQRGRVGQCADDRGCGWLFLDTSKNRSRRWCDINDCGNRAKQRRHYERARKHA